MIRAVLLVAAFLLSPAAARAERLTLFPAGPEELAAARAYLSALPLRGAELLQAGTARLLRDGQPVATLVSGREGVPEMGHIRRCFLLVLRDNTALAPLMTIGSGEWEAETCLGVAAIGLLPTPPGQASRIGLLYHAASPNAEPTEPIVLTLSESKVSIDIRASQRASEAGAVTLAAMRRLFAPR
ncbi:hypothetical protein [Roseomonas sp. WA12]